MKLWNVATGEFVRPFDAKPLHTRGDEFNFIADVGGVRSLAFSLDGAKLLCVFWKMALMVWLPVAEPPLMSAFRLFTVMLAAPDSVMAIRPA